MNMFSFSPSILVQLTWVLLVGSIVIKWILFVRAKKTKGRSLNKSAKSFLKSWVFWFSKYQTNATESQRQLDFMYGSNILNITWWIGVVMFFVCIFQQSTDETLLYQKKQTLTPKYRKQLENNSNIQERKSK